MTAGVGHGVGHLQAKRIEFDVIQSPETGKQRRFLELQVVVDRPRQRVELVIESRGVGHARWTNDQFDDVLVLGR